jgi:hypothetical protein
MPDNKEKIAPADSNKVNVNEDDYEIQYWTKKFSCTEAELREAVQAVGTSAEAVERYLKE